MPSAPLVLWYPRPARQWLEALPVGNGRLGAMVFGGTERERLQLNEDTLWAGGPHDYDNPAAREALPEVRRLVFAGDHEGAERLADAALMGVPVRQMPYQTIGSLLLDLHQEGEVSDYRRELDLEQARATVSYRRSGVLHRREVFASVPDQVIAVRLSAEAPGAVSLTASFTSPLARTAASSPDGRTLALDGTGDTVDGVEGAVRFRTLVRAVAEGGTVESAEGVLRITGADAVTLLVTARTSYNGWRDADGDERGRAARDLAAAGERPVSSLRERHVTDYRALFDRTSLELPATPAAGRPTDERVARFGEGGDPHLVALYFQYGRYLLLSCSRPGTQPANLQGLWNDLTDPPWGCKFTININTQMNYWPAAPANLLECWEPLFALLEELAEAGARTAAAHYGAGGWVAHHNTDAWRGTAPADGAFWGLWPTGGAWLALAVHEHHRFTGDTAALRERFWVLAGAARFFLDYLVTDPHTGALVTCPSLSPENAHHAGPGGSLCAGPAMDSQILHELFTAVAEAAALLGTEPALRREVLAARDRLAPPRVGAGGRLQEWQADWDAQAPEQDHRHVSHLYALHPGHGITAEATPGLFAAARKSLEARGDAGTGWSLAWKINLWARLLDGDRSWKLLAGQLTPERTAPNLFDLHPPFQIDGNFGAVAGVAEWLVQSHADEVALLPALPGALPEGSVRGLLARGGFAVDVSWRDGTLRRARITSRAGRPLRLRTAVPVRVTCGGRPVTARREAPGVTAFGTEGGAVYEVTPVPREG
ncbi:glycoside hydrolase family 95 protein [Streptomyces sp. TRM 70351]|uniref:glycoside hydrolase family 95 protein n=1 Tax=Streptomyces sp. TRM 70351 TaxID=3116552 RepID=UPI002E7C2FE2|nr:glycoside hydrolase family 95 protein [Streptomyces sp. TRM 70351]MEE1927213.1 glycoside hydrolase family 95 protein [Streptomyces sp. TRM 70351]